MHSEIVKYQAIGQDMQSILYRPDSAGGKGPAILLFPEAFGLGAHSKEKAEQLAALGYVVLASDLFGNGKTVEKLDEAMPFVGPLLQDPQKLREYGSAALQALKARPEVDDAKIVALGYCMGGTVALELARGGFNIQGAAGFHSGLGKPDPEGAAKFKGRILVCNGADDPMIGPDARQGFIEEMSGAKVDYQMHLYGGVVHGYTNKQAASRGMPDAIRYSASADQRSWAALVGFLKEIFA